MLAWEGIIEGSSAGGGDVLSGQALVTSPFGVGAVVTILIALAFWLDRRFRLFSFLGTAILVITGAALLVNARIIPPSVPVGDQQTVNSFYLFASDYAVPLAIVLLLATADLRSLRLLGRSAILAWILAAVGTILGTVVAVLLLSGAIWSWKLGGMYAASYVGGGVNYTAVGEAVDASDTLFATGAAADTIMTNVWMVATALIPALFVRFYASIYDRGGIAEGISAEEEGTSSEAFWQKKEVSIYDLAYLAAVVFTVLALAELISTAVTSLVGFEVPIELWYTTLALLAAFTPVNRLNGGEELGNFLLHLFFAVLGAGTVLSTLIGQGPIFFLFLVILVGIHALVVFGIGRWRKIEIETLCVASQATVGGPSTALALAISKRWSALVTPSVLLGVLGYATGNYIGVGMAYLIRSFTG
jgi:uncharacterized membrane protein